VAGGAGLVRRRVSPDGSGLPAIQAHWPDPGHRYPLDHPFGAAALPDAFLPGLAGSLYNLSIRLDGLGRREAALAATEEGVAIYWELAAAYPDVFLADLAQSLVGLGVALSALDDHAGALGAARDAVSLYSEILGSGKDTYRPAFEHSVRNLVSHLRNLGKDEAEISFELGQLTLHHLPLGTDPER
jgi:tetratricopeptide (TPR) repeat protein